MPKSPFIGGQKVNFYFFGKKLLDHAYLHHITSEKAVAPKIWDMTLVSNTSIIWVILGGFYSWTFFDLSLCFWVTGQIICKKMNFSDFDPICIFLTIDFCENLQEYFFVWNQFLIIKTIRKNAKIFYKFNISAKMVSH